MISAKEQLVPMVFTQPMLAGDAVVVLAGEDGAERLAFGVHAFLESSAWGRPTLVISGGVDSESQQSAKTLFGQALSKGVAHDRVLTENESSNTREQAVNVVTYAKSLGWKRIILVASPNHIVRATLTFIKALEEAGKEKEVRILPVSTNHLKWSDKPRGQKYTRAELYQGEFVKIALYENHVASFESGIEYLRYWEQNG